MKKIDSIIEYQQLACKTFKEHRPLTKEEAMLLDWVLGLPGEVGEVCEIIKHHIFHGEDLDKVKLAKELGDVFWYLGAICKTVDIPADGVLSLNIGKLQHRYDNGGFDKVKSAQRRVQEKKFEETTMYKQLKGYINREDEPSINIVLVGNECTGKTTIAKILSKELGMEYYKGTFREDDKLTRATDLVCNAENTIFDRLYIPDEIVYRELKKDPLPQVERDAFLSLAGIMEDRNFLIIYLDAQVDVIIKRLRTRGDEFISEVEIPKISKIYDKVLAELDLPTVNVDTSNMTIDETVERLLHLIGKFKEALHE